MKPLKFLLAICLFLPWTIEAVADEGDDMAGRIARQMAAPDRHSFDLPRDEARKPLETFQFLGLESGMTVMDVGAYAGYTTEMLAAAVGPQGTVYSQNTEQVYLRYADGYYKRTMDERLAGNRLPNVILLITEYDDLGFEGELDMAFLGNLLHDFLNRDGEEAAARFLASIYRALKPGGVLGVVDHVGAAGVDNGPLHRMQPSDARELLRQAGFVIEAESDLFANPQDDHSLMVYNDDIYRHTDRFFFKAVKPAAMGALADTTRFCLEGEFDLGARFQGSAPKSGEFYPATWCVVTDGQSERALFSAAGQSNPDMAGDWTVAYLPPDLVRIVNPDSPPDIEFHGTNNAEEARSVRRLDPHRLLSEFFQHPERFQGMTVVHENGYLQRLEATTDLPLRGRVPVVWEWQWGEPDRPAAQLTVDRELMLRGTGRWEELGEAEAEEIWAATAGAEPVVVPGDRWPARVAMELVALDDGVYLVRGVRTGFQHIVVEIDEGLVIGDAPAGWAELHQLPPSDLVPGLGISGLSEQLVDFLARELPGKPIAAVALTHFHDDHVGGAGAFAAAGALVYAPGASEAFLERALNRAEMPDDRLKQAMSSIDIVPVVETVTIGQGNNSVKIVPLGSNPHVDAMLGLWAVGQDYFFVSDIHVPNSEDGVPRAERARTECWFARWATNALPDSVRVVNSHSGIETPVSRLREYLESEACRVAANG